MPDVWLFAAQVAPPEPGDNSWAWVAGVMAVMLMPLGVGAFFYLKGQIEKRDAQLVTERKEARDDEERIRRQHAEQIAKYEEKLNESSEMILKQAESQIAQVSALQQTVQTLQVLLETKGMTK